METITVRIRRGGATESRRLELRGHRLLGGHADTGIFRIVENDVPRATAQRTPPLRNMHRGDDDGLATASIEIIEPLALAEEATHNDPYHSG